VRTCCGLRSRIVVGLVTLSVASVACVSAPTLPTPSQTRPLTASERPIPDSPAPAASEPPPWSRLVAAEPVLDPFGGIGNQFIFDTVAYHDGFLAVGEDLQFNGPVDAAVWGSPDGRTWERVPTAGNDLANGQIDSVAAAGNRVVALGGARSGDADPGDGQRIVWISDDGRQWRRQAPDAAFAGASLRGLAGGPGGFVAWDADASGTTLFWSADGTAWTRLATGAMFDGFGITDLAPSRAGFVAVGARLPPPSNVVGGPDRSIAAAWWSPDGRTWAPSTIDEGPGLRSLDVGANGLIALGGGSCGGCVGPAAMWRSSDGRSWHHVGDDVSGWPAYASDGARIVRDEWQASGDVFESTDGAAWRRIGSHERVDQYGLTVGTHGILITESIARGGPPDEADAGVWYLAAQ
jgi:hypothetical protein